MEKTKDEVDARNKALVFTIMFVLMLLMLTLTLTGCASYVVKDADGKIVSSGDATGFLRTITVTEKYDADGKLRERKISTDSTTKEVLMGLDKFIDTAVNTASKLKP